MKIKSWTTLECKHKHNFELFSVDATNGFRMWRDLILKHHVIAGAGSFGANNDIAAGRTYYSKL